MSQTAEQAEQAVRTSREILADLLSRRGKIDADTIALQSARDTLAYGALTGDAKAKKRLDDINRRLAALRDDEAAVSAAIRTANDRVAFTEAQQRAAVDQDNTAKALILVDGLRAQGAHLDETVQAMLAAYDELKRRIRELRSLGTHPVSEANMQLGLGRALESALSGTDMSLPLHPPGQRQLLRPVLRR